MIVCTFEGMCVCLCVHMYLCVRVYVCKGRHTRVDVFVKTKEPPWVSSSGLELTS